MSRWRQVRLAVLELVGVNGGEGRNGGPGGGDEVWERVLDDVVDEEIVVGVVEDGTVGGRVVRPALDPLQSLRERGRRLLELEPEQKK